MTRLLGVLFVLIALAGCGTVRQMPGLPLLLEYDFSPYEAEGFLFIARPYVGRYDVIGPVSIVVHLMDVNVQPGGGPYAGLPGSCDAPEVPFYGAHLTPNDLVHLVYEQARRKGADGIVGFNVTTVSERHGTCTQNVRIRTVEVAGLAVKRTQ